MTFLEAAIEILRQAGKPLTVKELTERSVKQNLLSVVGRAPETTMKNRLTEELAKARTPLIKVGASQFGLARYDRPAGTSASPPAPTPAAEGEGDGERTGRRRRRRGGRGRRRGGESVEASPQPEAGTPEEAIAAEQLAEEAEDGGDGGGSAVIVDIDAFQPQTIPRRGNVELPSEESLAAEYAEELEEGAPVAVAPEPVVDEKSADEDRPMLAPIQAERDRRDRRRGPGAGASAAPGAGRRGGREDRERQREDRRKERERQRDERRQARDQQRGPQRPPREKPPRQAPVAVLPIPVSHPPAHISRPLQPPPAAVIAAGSPLDAGGGTLADIAHNLLRGLNDPRPIHARQIVAMALKRKVATGDAEDLFRAMRAALLDDARARQARGLRPRVRHHGGSLFALATSRVDPELAAAEQALAERASALADETRFAVRRRLSQLPPMALEQLARVYLERTGWREVTLVKRVEATTYLSARIRRGALGARTLIGVRAGAEEIDRRAVGELRAGVAAKALDDALLIGAALVSEEGEREVRAPGPWITVLDGDAFADELIRAGVGLLRVAMPIAYLDADFFVELVQS